jgi:hypothetical protein
VLYPAELRGRWLGKPADRFIAARRAGRKCCRGTRQHRAKRPSGQFYELIGGKPEHRIGVPPAAQTEANCRRSRSITTIGLVAWPAAVGTPPMVKPMVLRTNAAAARPISRPRRSRNFASLIGCARDDDRRSVAPEAMISTGLPSLFVRRDHPTAIRRFLRIRRGFLRSALCDVGD